MFCPYCGKELEDGSKFCPYCGSAMEVAQEAPQPAAEAVPVQPEVAPQPAAVQAAPAQEKSAKAKKEKPAKVKGEKKVNPIPFIAMGSVILIGLVVVAILLIRNFTMSAEEKLAKYIEKGNKLIESAKYEKAVDVYDKALEIDPHSYDAGLGKAKALISLDLDAEAIVVLEDMCAYFETKPHKKNQDDVFALLAQEYFDIEDLGSAAITIRRATVRIDSDDDGAPDFYERMMGTDPDVGITDDVAYADGAVLMDLHTGADSADITGALNGDSDGDGLSNYDELKYGTNPFNPDSDGDGLNDYREVYLYYTDPLNMDSDSDGLYDGTEVDAGLNPMNEDSYGDGTNDGKREFERTTYMPSTGNPGYLANVPVLWANCAGELRGSVDAVALSRNTVAGNIGSIIGLPYEFAGKIDTDGAKIGFVIPSTSSVRFYDASDVMIAKYNYDKNMLEFLDTEVVDLGDGSLRALTDYAEGGTYLLVNYKRFKNDASVSNFDTVMESGMADVVFVIDTTGSMSTPISNVKTNIKNFVAYLADLGVDVRVGLVEYKDIYHDGPSTTIDYGFYYDLDDFVYTIDNIRVTGGGDRAETAVDALQFAYKTEWRPGVSKYAILITDADNKNGTQTDPAYTLDDIAADLSNGGICTSVVTYTKYIESGEYSAVVGATDGIQCDINGDFYEELIPLMDKMGVIAGKGTWVRLTNGSIVCLDADPALRDASVDTDGDGIADIDELSEIVTVSYKAPDGSTVSFEAYSFKTSPVLADSDGDGYIDSEDTNPTHSDVLEFDLKISDEFVPVMAADGSAYFGGLRKDGTYNSGHVALLNYMLYLRRNAGYSCLGNINTTDPVVGMDFIDEALEQIKADSTWKTEEYDLDEVYKGSTDLKKIASEISDAYAENDSDSYIAAVDIAEYLARYVVPGTGRVVYCMSFDAFTNDEIVDEIEHSLDNNHPAMLQAGLTDGVVLYTEDKCITEGITIGSHEWVTVIGYTEDAISGKDVFKVVYDGVVYYVDADAFMNRAGFTGFAVGIR